MRVFFTFPPGDISANKQRVGTKLGTVVGTAPASCPTPLGVAEVATAFTGLPCNSPEN